MIRVRKDPQIPASLQKPGSGYDYPDVSEQLVKDHDGKCYLMVRAHGETLKKRVSMIIS